MDFQTINWEASLLAILPELLMTVLAVVILALDLTWPGSRRREIGIISGIVLFSIAVIGLVFSAPPQGELAGQLMFGGMIRHDMFSQIFRTMIIIGAALTCLLSVDVERLGRRGHYYALIVIATIGACFMASASDLVMAFIALETTSITLYMLAGYLREDERSAEAGVKYFLYGAVMSAVTLYGLSLLYGFSGQTNIYLLAAGLTSQSIQGLPVLIALIMVLVGFGFKISAVPFHFWTPDVYEGAPTPVTTFVSVASKAASFALLMRFFMAAFPAYDELWVLILAGAATVTMTLGNLLALWQRNIKRLLAYSSIAQAGYILIGVVAISANAGSGMAAAVFYLFMYTLTNVVAFGVVILASRVTGNELVADFAGLSRRSPGLALAMTVALLSLGGIPPAAGFFGKFFLFTAAVDSGFIWLALVGVINSIIALYYYLMVIKVMYVDRSASEGQPIPVSGSYRWALGLATLGVILLGIVVTPVYAWALQAGQALLLN